MNWHNGKTAMMGTSYNGTIPIAAATTGVDGLAAIVPISAISDWYDYYRANGAVRAPHSAIGGATNNTFQGEDLDVLADLVYSRRDEQANPPGRVKCRPFIDAIKATVARETGDRTPMWVERGYMKDVGQAEGRDADRPRQQRLQRHEQERGAALRGAQGPGHAEHVLLLARRPFAGRAAGLPGQPVVHASTSGARTTASRTSPAPGSCARRRPARRVSRR